MLNDAITWRAPFIEFGNSQVELDTIAMDDVNAIYLDEIGATGSGVKTRFV